MSAGGAKRPGRQTDMRHGEATGMSAGGAKRPGRQTDMRHGEATGMSAGGAKRPGRQTDMRHGEATGMSAAGPKRGTVPSCEPDEARGSPRHEAYSLYVERRGRPSNEVWRSKLAQSP